MFTDANEQEGFRCLEKAKFFLAQNDFDTAKRLGQKAERMLAQKPILIKEARRILLLAEKKGVTHRNATTKTQTTSNLSTDTTSQTEQASDYSQFDPEQEKKCKLILAAHDYYKILGITRDCPPEDIKKAYRKLALQFHPDKAKCPSAEAAFKEISKAYQCLSNEELKKHYDTHGYEEATTTQQYRQQYEAHFMSPEDLFESFFGIQFPRNQYGYTRVYRVPSQYNSNQRQQLHILQILPFIILIAISLFSNLFYSPSQPIYSLTRNSSYPYQKVTSSLHVPYYVKNDFKKQYTANSSNLARLEVQIEMDYFSAKCSNELHGLFNELQTLKYYGTHNQYKRKSDEIRQKQKSSYNCQTYFDLKQSHPNHKYQDNYDSSYWI